MLRELDMRKHSSRPVHAVLKNLTNIQAYFSDLTMELGIQVPRLHDPTVRQDS